MGRYGQRSYNGNQYTQIYDQSTGQTFDVVNAKQKFFDHFLGAAVDTNAWTEVEVGDSTKAIASSVLTYHLHVTGESEDAGIYGKDDKQWNLDKGWIFEARVAVHVAPTIGAEVFIGMVNDSYGAASNRVAAADEVSIHAGFVFDGGLVATIHTDDSANDNNAKATGLTAVLDAYHVFTIDATSPANVKFFIDGQRVAATTTFDMSTGANVGFQPMILAQKNGADAGLGDIYVDYVGIWQMAPL
jgi:hypothetical protein